MPRSFPTTTTHRFITCCSLMLGMTGGGGISGRSHNLGPNHSTGPQRNRRASERPRERDEEGTARFRPAWCDTPNRAFRLLHFSFAPLPLAESKGLNPDSIEIFATTDQALDSTSGEALLSRLHELIPLREITVYVRRHTWFVDIPGFPLHIRFKWSRLHRQERPFCNRRR